MIWREQGMMDPDELEEAKFRRGVLLKMGDQSLVAELLQLSNGRGALMDVLTKMIVGSVPSLGLAHDEGDIRSVLAWQVLAMLSTRLRALEEVMDGSETYDRKAVGHAKRVLQEMQERVKPAAQKEAEAEQEALVQEMQERGWL